MTRKFSKNCRHVRALNTELVRSNMANTMDIKYECPLNIPKIRVTFNGGKEIILNNHSDTHIDLEPGKYTIRAVYSLYFGESQLDYDKTIESVVEGGFDYEARICPILKIFSFNKIYVKKAAV